MSDKRISNGVYVSVDFDGTIVTHVYPEVGTPVPGAIETMKELHDKGYDLILLTMRGHKLHNGRDTLQEAIDYLETNGVTLFGVNENPTQSEWTSSQKVYANIYIDDATYGCPLIEGVGHRPYVDWKPIRKSFGLEPLKTDDGKN